MHYLCQSILIHQAGIKGKDELKSVNIYIYIYIYIRINQKFVNLNKKKKTCQYILYCINVKQI